MSIINQMLQDLESRNVKPNEASSMNADEISAPKIALSWKTTFNKNVIEKWVLIILLVIFAAFVLRLVYFHKKPLPIQTIPVRQIVPPVVNIAPKKESNPIVESGEIIKTIEPISTQQLAEKSYNQALLVLNEGNIKEAIHHLQESLTLQPDYLPAQQALITLLLQQKEADLAGKYLDQALNQRPQSIGLLQLKARMQLMSNDPNAALSTLQSFSPTLADNPDYYALIAAIQQQLGNFVLAEQLYRQIIMVQPNDAKGWVGLGVALEAQQNMNSAMEAYQRAAVLHTLDPNLQAFVDAKLQGGSLV